VTKLWPIPRKFSAYATVYAETKQVSSLHCVSRLEDSDIGHEEWVLSNLGDVALATRFEND